VFTSALQLFLSSFDLEIDFYTFVITWISTIRIIAIMVLAIRLIPMFTARVNRFAAEATSVTEEILYPLVEKAAWLCIILIGAAQILWTHGVNVSGLAAGLGLGGLAFALAAKDTVENIFGAVAILIDQPFRVGDNIAMGLDLSPEDFDRAVHLAVMEEDVARLAEGLDTRVGTRGVTLSGGQVQRSAAARMFARRPDLLVFDDASSALDVRTEHAFWTRLFEQEGDRPTCLAVSHRLEAYRRADQILVVEDGRIAARGNLRTLLKDSPLFHEIWTETLRAHAHGEEAVALPT
jgi:ABC-type lipoprotein export system ATPase subunit